MRTFYDILEVSRSATSEEIIVAYRKKVITTHPDKGGNNLEFINVKKAYDILSDLQQRKRYDAWLQQKENKTSDSLNKESENNKEINIKKRIYKHLEAILEQYCKDETLYQRIKCIYDYNPCIYSELDHSKLNKILAAQVITRCLEIIIKERKFIGINKALLLYTICNDILSGKKDVNIKQEDDKDNLKGCFIVLGTIGIVLFFLFIAPTTKEVVTKEITAREYTTQKEKNLLPELNPPSNETAIQEHITKKEEEAIKELLSELDLSYNETNLNTGDNPFASYFGKGKYNRSSLSELTILNYSSNDAVVILNDLSDKVVRCVFIKENSEFTMNKIPEGVYLMKIMYGNSWNEEKDNGAGNPKGGFMKNISFSRSKKNNPFKYLFEEVENGINYPTYSVTLHKVKDGNMRTEKISKHTFFH